MTPTVLAHKLWSTRRGVGLLIVALLAVIVALLYAIMMDTTRDIVTVRYGSAIYAPDKPAYCPGEIMVYPVQVDVLPSELPLVRRVTEAWRRDQDGVTLQSTANSYNLPLVAPISVSTSARRAIPDLPAGVYWLDHVSENGAITGYTVGPVMIKVCKE